MPLYIRSEEADALARELAARLNLTITEAVTVALREKLAATPEAASDDFARLWADIQDLQRRAAEYPDRDPRHPDDILYDESGLPK
jgi:antitoxin VapB